MSPIPSPTPIRRTVLRILFSPAGLLFGFVVLLIATCPGARGGDAMDLLVAKGSLPSFNDPALSRLDSLAAHPAPALGRSSRLDRVPVSGARSATPAERQARSSGMGESQPLRHSRATLPLLFDPLPGEESAPMSSSALRPMTGPAVGVPRQLPTSRR